MTTRAVARPRFFYGYWILLVAFLALFVQSGCGIFAFSLFVRPLQDELGWARGEIMAGFTIFYLVVGISSPFIGRVVDRFGAKRLIVLGAAVTGLGFASLMFISQLWHYYLGYAVVGIGVSAMGQVPTSAVVSTWFRKKRGLAIGIMSMAVGGGGVAITPLVGNLLLPDFGWRIAYLALGIIAWVLVIPVTLLFLKPKPADMGLYPDGVSAAQNEEIVRSLPQSAGGMTLKVALKTHALWLLCVSFFLSTMSNMVMTQSQVPHLQDIGFPVAAAATALSAYSFSSSMGKFTFGWLCDRIQPRYSCAIGLIFQVAGLLLLMNMQGSSPIGMVWLFAILGGFGTGSWLPTMSILSSTTFGLAYYGSIFGVVSMAQGVGTAIGPFIAGTMFDAMGTYHWAFLMFVLTYAISLPAILLLKRPKGG